MKKLLVTGSSGMLGSNLVCELADSYELHGIYRTTPNPELQRQHKIDIRDFAKVKKLTEDIKPDFVVHCAALTDVDTCEQDYVLARQTNAIATKHLATTIGSGARFIYISTDSVFDGRKGNYSETDLPSPLNSYAKTKLEGEWFVEQSLDNYVIVRTNMFGWNRVKGRSFAEWVFGSLKQDKHINMFTDVIFSAVSVSTLCSFIDRLLGLDFVGRLNIGSKDQISKYDFGITLAELAGLDKSLITPVGIDSFEFKAPRPQNTSLDVSRAQEVLGPMPNIQDEIAKFYSQRSKKL